MPLIVRRWADKEGSRPPAFLSGLIALGALVAACGAESETLDHSATVQLSLELDSRVQIDEVAYVITGDGSTPIAGTIDTRASEATASVEVFGLPPGDGYQVAMSATSTDGETTCEGMATFVVASGQATSVMVTLRGKGPPVLGSVRVDGTINVCAQLDKVIVSPLQTSRGSTIDVHASGRDEEGDPLAYRWTTEGGTIVDPSGNVMAVFSDIRTDGGPLWTSAAAQSRLAGESWGAAESISPQVATGPTYAGSPQVVTDAKGNFTTVWSETNVETPQGGIWANRYLADGRWGIAVLISDGATSARAPQVAADPQGNVTAIWLQQTVGDTVDHPRDLYASRYQVSGSWDSAVRVSNGASTAIDQQLVIDLDGNVTTAWIQSVGMRTTIWANRHE